MTAVPQAQTSISRRALDIEDYIDIARRHVSWIIGPLYAGIVISTMVAFFLPNVYVSRAMMRITPSQIPENLVPATFNQQMSDRISAMWQDVVSRSSLSELIQRPSLDLYRKERNSKPLEDVIEDMKNKDIKIEILGLQQTGGKPNSAFTISYRYPDRYKAQSVVSALVTKLTDANQVAQRMGVNITNDLMTDEVKAAKDTLDKMDQELTAFKEANRGRLPEELQLNLSAMNSLQTQLTSINDALSRNQQQKVIGEQTLISLKAQYSQLENSVASTTPEETAKQNSVISQNAELAQLNHEIVQGEAQLAVMLRSLTPEHPDVKDFKAKLDALKQRRDQMKKEDAAAAAAALAAETSKPKTPAVKRPLSLQSQQSLAAVKTAIDSQAATLQALELDRVQKQKEQDKINAKLALYEQRIEASPINEQKYVSMTRERGVAAQHYDELQRKQQLAEQGKEVSNRKAGESLDLAGSGLASGNTYCPEPLADCCFRRR